MLIRNRFPPAPCGTSRRCLRAVRSRAGSKLFPAPASCFAERYLRRVGQFSEDYFMYAEDLDLCYKAVLAGCHELLHPAGTNDPLRRKKQCSATGRGDEVEIDPAVYRQTSGLQLPIRFPCCHGVQRSGSRGSVDRRSRRQSRVSQKFRPRRFTEMVADSGNHAHPW